MGSVTAPERAEDSIEMARIVFGEAFVGELTIDKALLAKAAATEDRWY